MGSFGLCCSHGEPKQGTYKLLILQQTTPHRDPTMTIENLSKTYVTDAHGEELPITEIRDPRAAFHFTQIGTIKDGTVWRCDSISGRSMVHRLTFSSYYAHPSRTGHPMGWLLHRQMLAHEATARWERQLETQHVMAA
jgi:hypothetical protein